MQTIITVARVEFLLLLRERRTIFVGLALWVMLGVLLTTSQTRFLCEQKEMAKAQQISRQQWQARDGGSGHALAHYGTYVYRQANVLSALHPGSEPYVGVAAHIVAHEQTNMFYRPMLDGAAIERWADASGTTLLQIVVPLLLLLLAFSCIAGDREDGRLRFLLGQGTSPSAFAVGKLTGVAAMALALLLPAALIVVLLIGHAARTLGDNNDLLARLLLLLASYGALYVFFLAIGVALSAISSTRQTALLLCVGLWAVLCLVTPRALTTFAEIRFSTPEVDVLKERIDAERKDRKAGRTLAERVLKDALVRYKVRREEDLPVRLDALRLQAGEEFVNAINDKHMGQVWSQFAAQERWVGQVGSFLTPAIAMRNSGETVSGTDGATLRGHVAAIENFRRDWVRRLNEADAARPRSGERAEHDDERASHAKWASFPSFEHEPPALSTLMPQNVRFLAVLWGWAAVAVLASVFSVQLKSGANHGNG